MLERTAAEVATGRPPLLDNAWLHVALVVAVSVGFESAFLRYGINVLDEGWPLYAAMRLHAGGVLYDDVFFSFPPGHLLPAWIAYAVDAPGVFGARVGYAAFNVALCVALYGLGRRLMSPGFALLGALLLAVAAPQSHSFHALFGYRYLVWSVLALLAFAANLRTGNRAWLLAAGVLTGIALCFRLTPAFATACGIGMGVVVARRSWPERFRDAAWLAGGILAAAAPVLAWFASSVGLDVLWREAVVRPVEMTALLTRPMPELALPERWTRYLVNRAFPAVFFRLCFVLYAGYAVWLARGVWRSRRAGVGFPEPLLLAVAVWGGVYFFRTLGRSDVPHLDSAIPPVCLLMAHLGSRAWPLLARRASFLRLRWTPSLVSALALATWVALLGSDRYLRPRETVGLGAAGSSVRLAVNHGMRVLDPTVRSIQEWSDPDQPILDLSAAPMLYVLSERLGPGGADFLVPGTFLSDEEETAFLARLEANPPAVVVMPDKPFDDRIERSVQLTAPRIVGWVMQRYRKPPPRIEDLLLRRGGKFVLLVPQAPS